MRPDERACFFLFHGQATIPIKCQRNMVQFSGGRSSNNHAYQSMPMQILNYVVFTALLIWFFCLHDLNSQLWNVSDHKDHPNKVAIRHPYQPLSQEKCRPLRDVSNYSTSTVQYSIDNPSSGRQNSKYQSCLQFKCDWNSTANTHCDSFGPTIYTDPSNPPCCVHILRDMAAAFDAVMCKLGFEYFSSFGMLLGLVRNDKLIPWTSDNDYIATERTLAAMYAMSPEEKKVWDDHGLAFLFDNYYHRVCVTSTFMNGDLANLWTTSSYEWYPLVYPYADIFVAKERSYSDVNASNMSIIDQLECDHSMDSFRPAQRRGVYQNSFQVSMPNNAEKVLERVYGSTWRIPDKEKRPHGDTRCKG